MDLVVECESGNAVYNRLDCQSSSCDNKNPTDDEEIPLITVRKVNQENVTELKTSTNYTIFKTQISDIRKSELVNITTGQYNFFGIVYCFVKFIGTILSAYTMESDKTILREDAHGAITCFVYHNHKLKNLHNWTKLYLQDCVDMERSKDSNDTPNMMKKVVQKCKRRLDQLPMDKDIKQGDSVCILGRVKDFRDRIINVKTILRLDENDHLKETHHIEEIISYYKDELL